MKFILAALLGSCAFAVDGADDAVVAETTERTADEAAWYASFSTEVTDDLVTSACLCYDDLSTWDLRPMSFAEGAGYYTVYEGTSGTADYRELYFNPCRYLDFAAVFPDDAALTAAIG